MHGNHQSEGMESGSALNPDLTIIGGGIAASFLCLDILKKDPEFKILIIENSPEFPQKIGESLVDMTALILEQKGISHLLTSQTKKSGIRFLFNEKMSSDRADIAEFASPTLPGRINAYHLDRKRFDQDLLDEVERKGVHVLRPAQVVEYIKHDAFNEIHVSCEGELFNIRSKWVVDASGRARFLHHKMGWEDRKIPLQTSSIMAHFRHIQPNEVWDTPENKYWDTNAIALRKFSTTHLMRPNSWWWIIRLDEVTTSIGVMFDSQKVEVKDAEMHFKELLTNDPELSKMTMGAEMGAIRYIENVPYVSAKLYEKGIALIGDSCAFLDPLFSPGLELIGQQSLWLSDLLVKERKSEVFDSKSWKTYESLFQKAYDTRLTMYAYAYGFMGSYDLFTTWTKLGNFVYLSRIVYPSVVFKSLFKMPLRFTWFEHMGVRFIGGRLNKIHRKRLNQHRTSEKGKNYLAYSGVRVPKDYRFSYIPVLLLFKAAFGYVSLELREMFSNRRSVHK